MCGFFGLQSYELDTNEKIATSKNAIKLLNSRGPDSNGVALDDNNNLVLCHNRLSILDLSSTGHQPMKSLSGNLLITYNGEIYNHISIREELFSCNNFNNWKGTSDTETLLQAVEIWGLEKTLQKVNGMFSFVIWNRISKSLYLARDRFGEKPLYYGWVPQNKSFVFSSDLIFDKLFNHIKFDINEDALNDLFHLNYINNNHSIYKNIHKLEPGCYSEVFFKKDQKPKINTSKYWKPEQFFYQDKNIRYKESVDVLDKKLTNIVKNQIFADVEVGTFLSGGIDSSLITAKAQEISSKKVKTFCIGTEDKSHDESKYASSVAKHLSTDHEELILNENEIIKDIPSIVCNLNEPLGDSSFIPTYYVSKLAQKKVKVVLTGDAGDEIFGGYNRYTRLKYVSRLYKLPKSLKKVISNSLSNLSEKNINRINNLIKIFPYFKNEFYLNEKIKKLLDRIDPNLNFSDFLFSFLINNNKLNLLNKSEVFSKEKIFKIFNEQFSDKKIENFQLEEKMMFMDTINYLPNDILCKVDRASMANSLETRAPFLDKDLYEFSLGLSIDQKIKKNKGKIILRDLLKRKIPDNLIDRPKAGFSIPIGTWLRKPLLDWSENLLSKKNLEKSGLLNFNNINKIWSDHKKGIDNSGLIWSILVFQQWYLNR
jgi:asparagine synthase (glutamine-hydrolysing)